MQRIAITGPESTGKSVLSSSLARRFNTVWVPEYARLYLENLGKPYVEKDIFEIARGQYESELKLAGEARTYLFTDTEFLVTKIWSLIRYKRCHPWIESMFIDHRYDLYLLCDIDLPWEYDPLREHPGMRQYLFDIYRSELDKSGFPYAVVSGQGNARLENAVKIIQDFHF